jgi:sugar (pentulose or hexulose) kinase
VHGIDLNTTASDIVRAVCEGVAYTARNCLDAAKLEGEVAICGGGAESGAWRQVLADVLQKPLKIARRPEVGARGAAMAALIASDQHFDREEWTRPEGYVEPRQEMADLYEEGFAAYLSRLESARELWERLSPNAS